MKNKSADKIRGNISTFFTEPTTKYVGIFIPIISILLIAQAFLDGSAENGRFLSLADKQLVLNFLGWFGVLLGIVLATVLEKVWQQFDALECALDSETNAIKSLVGDLRLLSTENDGFRSQVLCSLFVYSKYVLFFIDGRISANREIEAGAQILNEIRGYYIKILRKGSGEEYESDVLKSELFTQLNNIIAARGNRISLTTQRIFESLNFMAVFVSIIWLLPFYFLYFPDPQTGKEIQLGIFGWLLVILVTFFIIIILSVIDDLDKPFDGFWRVNKKSWENLVAEINKEAGNKRSQDNDSVPRKVTLQRQNGSIHSTSSALPRDDELNYDKDRDKPIVYQ